MFSGFCKTVKTDRVYCWFLTKLSKLTPQLTPQETPQLTPQETPQETPQLDTTGHHWTPLASTDPTGLHWPSTDPTGLHWTPLDSTGL